ncbi:MAG: hypothetical protein WA958_15065 [Tunicatimonas sp.]
MIKSLLLGFASLVFIATLTTAQSFRAPDNSPLDNASFPDHFAHDRKSGDELVKELDKPVEHFSIQFEEV